MDDLDRKDLEHLRIRREKWHAERDRLIDARDAALIERNRLDDRIQRALDLCDIAVRVYEAGGDVGIAQVFEIHNALCDRPDCKCAPETKNGDREVAVRDLHSETEPNE